MGNFNEVVIQELEKCKDSITQFKLEFCNESKFKRKSIWEYHDAIMNEILSVLDKNIKSKFSKEIIRQINKSIKSYNFNKYDKHIKSLVNELELLIKAIRLSGGQITKSITSNSEFSNISYKEHNGFVVEGFISGKHFKIEPPSPPKIIKLHFSNDFKEIKILKNDGSFESISNYGTTQIYKRIGLICENMLSGVSSKGGVSETDLGKIESNLKRRRKGSDINRGEAFNFKRSLRNSLGNNPSVKRKNDIESLIELLLVNGRRVRFKYPIQIG